MNTQKRRRSPTKLTDAMVDACVRDYVGGMSAMHVANKHLVANNTVLRHLKLRGIPIRHPFASDVNVRRKAMPIQPFPDHIDRAAFASWLSGFTDGEGSFSLCVRCCERTTQAGSKKPRWTINIGFGIELRDDDIAILGLIQSFFGAGTITEKPAQRKVVRGNPSAKFGIYAVRQLHDLVIPHFEQYPLRAKKITDYRIWKEAVLLSYGGISRPIYSRKSVSTRWTQEEINRFTRLADDLKAARVYKPKTQP